MAPSPLGIPLQIPSVYCPSVSSSCTSSTSDLNSTTYSPRALYAETFHRPYSSESALVTASKPRYQKKSMKDMTGNFATTEDEFEQLPIAVRRKYFSTLERLRFAQNSRSTALNELPIQKTRRSSLADRRGLSTPVIESRKKSSDSSSRRKQQLSRQSSVTSNEASWFLTLPEKVRNKQFTREEQVTLAGRLRESVILDAADEAIYKASRRASRNPTPAPLPQPPSPGISIDYRHTGSMTEEMFDTFRWIDEESDLDLSLNLDDYHANLDGAVIPSPTSNRRPSFRRHMSISKIPFGRSSSSSNYPRSPRTTPDSMSHSRQKSRAISLIAPKHAGNDSVASIDPNATHYQDPEARLKLRVYLASPQKFDEAIEFGFPSMDGVADGADKENRPPKPASKDSAVKQSFTTDKSKGTFLNDDTASLLSDDISMADPDSPITPMDPKHRTSPSHGNQGSADYSHLGITKPTLVKQPGDSYTQAMAGNREMTLRMTLTRPDLRADESKIYGWQTARTPNIPEDPLALDELEGKYDGRGPFGGPDGWGPEKDNGVVKRIWNKVKSQRKFTA